MKALKNLIIVGMTLCLSIMAAGMLRAEERIIPVVIRTSLGDITVALYPERAPVTVDNFLKNMEAGLYRGGLFYRAVRLDNQRPAETTITLIQGGRNRAVEARPPIVHETTEQTGILHRDGVISMARLAPGTADSEFFITIGDNPALDYGSDRNPDRQGYAAFGVVISGMDVVRKIQQQPTTAPVADPASPVRNQIMSRPVEILDIVRK
ncbi:peptidylprolyl isomerase [Luteithermobacter gelatinilyticus]|uniref:peptidylprolyl isomerase n=1 Tax=Luteithermobacter gelatinilyticus TaxID=2582913 RepID=UPI001AEFDB9B|nr:peptidylprolyl isomerase [Luteithermobacter gelatinilyticus]